MRPVVTPDEMRAVDAAVVAANVVLADKTSGFSQNLRAFALAVLAK